MATTHVIKVSEEHYRWLARIAADLQKKRGEPVSLNEALREIKLRNTGMNALLHVAGKWKRSDSEVEKIESENKKLWKTWKLQSV